MSFSLRVLHVESDVLTRILNYSSIISGSLLINVSLMSSGILFLVRSWFFFCFPLLGLRSTYQLGCGTPDGAPRIV